MRVFIPAEDGPFDEVAGPLVPYRYGFACAHALRGASIAMEGASDRHASSPENAPGSDLAATCAPLIAMG